MIEPVLTYVRMLHFIGPDTERQYFRLFGDLEYDLLALKTERTIVTRKLGRLRRTGASGGVSVRERHTGEKEDNDASTPDLYLRLHRFRERLQNIRRFKYDRNAEIEALYLLGDIAIAVLGLEDADLRRQHTETFNMACEAYGRLDLPMLIDLHESIQSFLAMERRQVLCDIEQAFWEERLDALRERYRPWRLALSTPTSIEKRTAELRRRIELEQKRLELTGLRFTLISKALRHVN